MVADFYSKPIKKLENKSVAAKPMFSGDISFMDCPRINALGEIPQGSLMVLGIPFDTSTSNRPGARFGPRGIRTASKMISWQKLYPWNQDLYGIEGEGGQVFDGGDINFDFGHKNSIIEAIEKTVSHVFQAGGRTLVLGGDHFISYPILKSIYQQLEKPLALVHFDAHYDMWDDEVKDTGMRIDHGTGFYHALREGFIERDHSFQIGLRTHKEDSGNLEYEKKLGIDSIDAFEADAMSAEEIANRIRKQVGKASAYLTFDIDSLDPAYAPGTGTPVCGGFTTIKVLNILKKLQGLDWIGGDVVEVSPPYDYGEVTALAGATIASYLGHLIMNKN